MARTRKTFKTLVFALLMLLGLMVLRLIIINSDIAYDPEVLFAAVWVLSCTLYFSLLVSREHEEHPI